MKEGYRNGYLSDQSHCSIVHFCFSDSEDEPADPNIIYEEPDDEASSSDKDVSDATGLRLFFFFRWVRSGGTK